jgi:uncharacterized protein with NRDE domain
MCLILVAVATRPDLPIVLAANRDEFLDRPTAPLGWWEDRPGILAGRDLKRGGTWLGVTRGGRLAAVTNYREPGAHRRGAPSRGDLVTDYLIGDDAPEEWLARLTDRAGAYNGFNLLVGDAGGIWWFSNRGGDPSRLEPGVHGLSNHLLDTPWPKVARGRARLMALLDDGRDVASGPLLDLLADRTRPPDADLPDTGVGPEWERRLGPMFIEAPGYGTRSSSVVLIEGGGAVSFVERTYDRGVNGEPIVVTRRDAFTVTPT